MEFDKLKKANQLVAEITAHEKHLGFLKRIEKIRIFGYDERLTETDNVDLRSAEMNLKITPFRQSGDGAHVSGVKKLGLLEVVDNSETEFIKGIVVAIYDEISRTEKNIEILKKQFQEL